MATINGISKITFIGCGAMGEAILKGILREAWSGRNR